MRMIAAAVMAAMCAGVALGASDLQPVGGGRWVFEKSDGTLGYGRTAKGSRIMDFSSAGYHGGGVKIPMVPVAKTISATGGDDAKAIQEAIDEVAKRPLEHGVRGAVLLQAGTYRCNRTIEIKASGVVLRGEGDGTVLQLTGNPHEAIAVHGSGHGKEVGERVQITDGYVASGATTFSVSSTSGFKAGDAVWVLRPATEKWVHFMGMDTLVRNGKQEHWVSGEIRTERTIAAIHGNEVTLDVPLTDSIDSMYVPGATMVKYVDEGRIAEVGVEGLRIVAPPQHVAITAPLYRAIRLENTADAWVRSVDIFDTTNSVAVGDETARVTVQDVSIAHTTTTVGAAKPADFSAEGTQVLFQGCKDKGDTVFYFVTGPRVTGPIVLLDCEFHGHGWIQPHQRWATGLLLDNCRVPEGGIEFMNRGIMGSGHGWTIGWSVAWNCVSKTIQIEQPPGAMNWAIGCRGEIDKTYEEPGSKAKLAGGVYESQGRAVRPESLYLAQLQERLRSRH
ncbi:MAG: hypothetical protein ACTHN5_02350 [Phycisphaerae bacterium]